MLDEVYIVIAERVEYTNGSFLGITENGTCFWGGVSRFSSLFILIKTCFVDFQNLSLVVWNDYYQFAFWISQLSYEPMALALLDVKCASVF